MSLVAVTGTNGKTTTVLGLAGLLAAARIPVIAHSSLGRVIGTVGPVETSSAWMAQPDWIAARINDWCEDVGSAGTVVAEVTSHWIANGFGEALRPQVVVLTSLGRDHLDAHGGVENYLAAKCRLLRSVANGGAVVFPSLLSETVRLWMAERWDVQLLEVGGADFPLAEPAFDADTQHMIAALGPDHRWSLRLPTISGAIFNNRVLALATAGLLGVRLEDGVPAAEAVPIPAGRMELLELDSGTRVVIDSCHNPEALRSCLRDIDALKPSRILVVIGAGGDRDVWKRAEFGRIATAHADVVIVTDDNSRSENPESIRSQVLDGTSRGLEIVPREDAIRAAIDLARPEDVVVVCGMGPDAWQGRDGARTTDQQVAAAHGC